MKTLAYLLISVGFLAASLVAVQTPANEIAWAKYVPALLPGLVGVVLARLANRQRAQHAGALQSNSRQLQESLRRIVANAALLEHEQASAPDREVHQRIDQLFRDDLNTFAEARQTISHLHGLQAYAAVMNEFAAGERYLNRVWSASVDGYVDEVREYLTKARHQFDQTKMVLDRYLPSPSNSNQP